MTKIFIESRKHKRYPLKNIFLEFGQNKKFSLDDLSLGGGSFSIVKKSKWLSLKDTYNIILYTGKLKVTNKIQFIHITRYKGKYKVGFKFLNKTKIKKFLDKYFLILENKLIL